MKKQYDVLIIVAGPGGEGAAIKFASANKSVAVVDEFYTEGGSCTHKGTIPSKTLRQNIQYLIERGDAWGMDYHKLLKSVDAAIDSQVNCRMDFLRKK